MSYASDIPPAFEFGLGASTYVGTPIIGGNGGRFTDIGMRGQQVWFTLPGWLDVEAAMAGVQGFNHGFARGQQVGQEQKLFEIQTALGLIKPDIKE